MLGGLSTALSRVIQWFPAADHLRDEKSIIAREPDYTRRGTSAEQDWPSVDV